MTTKTITKKMIVNALKIVDQDSSTVERKPMAKKIDIRCLDKKTLSKLEKYKNRIMQLINGETLQLKMPVVYHCAVVLDNWWMAGKKNTLKCKPCQIELDWPTDNQEKAQKQLDKLNAKTNKEIEKIVNFSNSVADKLKVNRSTFWNKIFA